MFNLDNFPHDRRSVQLLGRASGESDGSRPADAVRFAAGAQGQRAGQGHRVEREEDSERSEGQGGVQLSCSNKLASLFT